MMNRIPFLFICLLLAGCSSLPPSNPSAAVPPQFNVFVGKAGPEASPLDIGLAVQTFKMRAAFAAGTVPCTNDDILLSTNSTSATYRDSCDGTEYTVSYADNCEITVHWTPAGTIDIRCWVPRTNAVLSAWSGGWVLGPQATNVLVQSRRTGQTWATVGRLSSNGTMTVSTAGSAQYRLVTTNSPAVSQAVAYWNASPSPEVVFTDVYWWTAKGTNSQLGVPGMQTAMAGLRPGVSNWVAAAYVLINTDTLSGVPLPYETALSSPVVVVPGTEIVIK